MKSLLGCKFGRSYIIEKIDESQPFKIRRRLCELGFTSGQAVTLVRTSLLKKAYLVEIRGYTLSLRHDILKAVMVK